MAISTVPGYPRIGQRRELKWALEGYWSGKRTEDDLLATAAEVRQQSWTAQREAGLDLIPVNDFSLYDHVLDATVLLGAVPARYGWAGESVDLDTLFAMARGRTGGRPVRAMEMTKWFDTNYHFLVPELSPNQRFRLASDKPFAELAEATAAAIPAKPVLLGPLTFLLLGKGAEDGATPLALLDGLLPIYQEIVRRLADAGAAWIQLDEPVLALDRGPEELAALTRAYAALAEVKGRAKLLVQTAYGHVGEAYLRLAALPVDGIGLDLVRGPENLDLIARHGFPAEKWLAAGVVDGRNVWVNDLAASLDVLDHLQAHVSADRLMVSASCPLLHVPHDVRVEEALDPTVHSWLAFAAQKLDEIALLTRAVNEGRGAIGAELEANGRVLAARRDSALRRDPAVQARLASLAGAEQERASPAPARMEAQRPRLPLPVLPTTTIGSFPQTDELRTARRRFDRGEIDAAAYDEFLEQQIREIVRSQEEIGLDVLVHGEPERNDMVQYFGEQLAGFAFTQHGWVQSYGSRCVRPPIVFGDVSRPAPMTVRWATFAQRLTERPVKGMLTGPVTILNWSFVRDDQPREVTCRQIALAIRDEVADLDAAGIAVIQIDEPALREGLPLRRADQQAYLGWATACFRIAASAARDETQIHTHMCYSEFNDIIDAISALDADVISIENARSDNELLRVFRHHGYDKGIGPGVYDIHSPRVPPTEEILANLRATLEVLGPGQVWVNPDCGLKTRRWEEVRPALANMVAAARQVRETPVKVGRRGKSTKS
ncbi:MAG: 5-methyltetrahydropteroyltriglutamate--homocysteine S-methyltransferase [Chloroflexota bacterium]|nr:5-methyltetrahydropteroyltriglutamate--homocysteine S-methyltransferase [Chloroflexota bacterium]